MGRYRSSSACQWIPGRAREIDYSAYEMTDGKLVVPDIPGFGLKLI
jgi:hypothetical protein